MRDWKKEIQEVHPNLIQLEDIKSGSIKFKAKCSIDGYEWEYRAYDLLRGHGCHQCSGRPRYTRESFRKRFEELHPNMKLLSEYEGSHKKVQWECLVCKNGGLKCAYMFLAGNGCKNCSIEIAADSKRKTTEEFKTEFYLQVNSEYEVLGEYTHTDNDIKIKHLICGHVFESRPHNLLKKTRPTRCPKCNGGVRKKNSEYHKLEISELTNGDYELFGEYNGMNAKTSYKHIQCDRVFKTRPSSILHQGTRCPYCYSSSKGEISILNFLEENNFLFIREKTFKGLKDNGMLRFDFYLNKLNVCIEYDGRQHFEPLVIFGGEKEFISRKRKDLIKNKYCEENGIKLLRIPYYEKDIEGAIKRFIEEVSA